MAVDLTKPVATDPYADVLPQLRENIYRAASNGYRNLMINGNMEIANRNNTFAVSGGTDAYTLDRFKWSGYGSCAATISQSTEVPTVSEFGGYIQNSLKIDVTTADTMADATDYAEIVQSAEGYMIRGIYQRSFTYSTWLKFPTTGTFYTSFRNGPATRSYVKSHAIPDTGWNKYTVTVTETTDGTWDLEDGAGMQVGITLGCGSNFTGGTDGAWTSTNSIAATATAQTNFFSSTSYEIYTTGWQLEAGEDYTGFEFRPPQVEEALAGRYYEKSYDPQDYPGSTASDGLVTFQSPYTGTNERLDRSVHFRYPKRPSGSLAVAVYSTLSSTAGKVNIDGNEVNASVIHLGYHGMTVYGIGSGNSTSLVYHYIVDAEI